jgi:hypothetical protein
MPRQPAQLDTTVCRVNVVMTQAIKQHLAAEARAAGLSLSQLMIARSLQGTSGAGLLDTMRQRGRPRLDAPKRQRKKA